jgi:hypothetical protein
VKKRVVLMPDQSKVVSVNVSHRGPWTLTFHTNRPGYLADGRPISVQALMPTFAGTFCGTAPPTTTV